MNTIITILFMLIIAFLIGFSWSWLEHKARMKEINKGFRDQIDEMFKKFGL